MRILIIGASGLVGGAFYNKLKQSKDEILGTYNNYPLPALVKLDITNLSDVFKLISDFQPDEVIQPAAYADVEGCEKNQALCRKINIEGVRNVIDSCKKINTNYVFFSTDYVFDGKNGPYSEEDLPGPLNVYGEVKLQMERYCQNNLARYLIIRTGYVFGWEPQGKNFVMRLINNLRAAKEANIINDQFGTPTYVENLVEAVIYLVKHNHIGIFNVVGSTCLNRYDFGLQVAEVFNLNKNLIHSTTTDKIQQLARRPLKGGLKVDKVQKILPFKLLSSKEGLNSMLIARPAK